MIHTPPTCQIPADTATYNVRAYGLTVAKSTRTLSIKKKQYNFDNQVKSDVIFYKDKMTYKSVGIFTKDMLMPTHYTYSRQRKKQKSDIQFDWKKLVAHAMKNGEKKDVKIVPGTQDFVSSQLLLRELLLAGKNDLSYKLVKSNKLQTYQFSIIAKPTIKTDLGKLKTVELERIDGPRVSHFWLDPSRGYLMVQSDQYRNGSRQALVQITSYKVGKGCLFNSSN